MVYKYCPTTKENSIFRYKGLVPHLSVQTELVEAFVLGKVFAKCSGSADSKVSAKLHLLHPHCQSSVIHGQKSITRLLTSLDCTGEAT